MQWLKLKSEVEKEKTQLEIGTDVESEHNLTIDKIKANIKDNKLTLSDQEIFRSIAEDHILEDPEYYTKLTKAGL